MNPSGYIYIYIFFLKALLLYITRITKSGGSFCGNPHVWVEKLGYSLLLLNCRVFYLKVLEGFGTALYCAHVVDWLVDSPREDTA